MRQQKYDLLPFIKQDHQKQFLLIELRGIKVPILKYNIDQ